MGKQERHASRQHRVAEAAAARRRAKRQRVLTAAGAVVIVGLLAAIVLTVVDAVGADSTKDTAASTAMVNPSGATADGAIPIGRADAPVRVEVYLDYMCPYCGRFDRANAADLDRLVADGTVRLELHPLSFLDKASDGTRYSTRAANAVATVADRVPDKVLAVNRALYDRQPEEGGDGLTDNEISAIATEVGVPREVVDAFAGRTFEPWVRAVTDTAFASGGITGTPTVKINGKVFKGDLYTAGPLREAVTAARGQ